MSARDKTSHEPLVAIVDDDASVRRSTRRLLRCSGLRAESFASAEDFLQSERAGETACLILDVRMPGVDGLELQQRLLQLNWLVPTIFLSAQASDDEERRALRAGAVSFLRKPVSKETLLDAIRSGLKNKRITDGGRYDNEY
jgi:FixJ family two-component response regulator